MCTCSFTFNRSKSKNDVEHDLMSDKKGHKNASSTFIPKPIKCKYKILKVLQKMYFKSTFCDPVALNLTQ